MDTDEAGKHTQNILARVNRQQEDDKLATRLVEISSTKEPEHSTEDTQEDSDLDTTVLENLKMPGRFSDDLMVKEGLGEPPGEIDADLQRSFTRTLSVRSCLRFSLWACRQAESGEIPPVWRPVRVCMETISSQISWRRSTVEKDI